MLKSDHAPILAVLNSSRGKFSKPFNFENWWLLTDDFENIAKASWHKSCNRPFHLKTHFLAKDLIKLQKAKPKNSDVLRTIEDKLLTLQMNPLGQQNPTLQRELISQHENLLAKEEAYHRQRYKHNWSILGDRNTNLFHQAIIKRARKNMITHFLNPDGCYATTQNQFAQTANNYFKDIFASNRNCRHEGEVWSSQLEPIQAIEDNSFTDSTPDINEIHSILNSMRSNAAPGPNGLNVGFCKASWEWTGKDIPS